ncbi:hypothetical protein MNBD_GAMMA12-3120 [hydrothermal vent metagenome]|uniref:Histidine kinase n=1 Tax=hydrothermal vent metagenome TaxID=652676 RepID=A0A3B0Z1V4_9ZZZZ
MREKILDGSHYKGPGIVARLVIVVLCLYTLIFGAYTYWQVNHWIDQYQVQQIRSSERILAELAAQIRVNPEADNEHYVSLFRRYTIRDQFIRQITFRHRNGQVYSNLGQASYTQVPQMVEQWLKVKEDKINSVVKKDDAILGHLSIQLDTAFTRSQVWDQWVKMAMIVTSIAMFLVFVLLRFLHANVRVLRSLVSFGDNVVAGNYKARVVESGSAEARAASQTINQLATLIENMSFSMLENKKSLMSEIKRVEEDNLEAGKLRESAEFANLSKSEYLSNVSEEFRTPLTSIMSLSEMMMKPEYQSQQRHFSEMIHASAIHLFNYINNVLDIAQLESEEIVVKKEIFDFRGIFREVNEMAIPYAAQQGKTFNMMLDNDIPYYVVSDAPRIKQLMLSTICDVIANGEHPTVFMKCHILQSNVLSLAVQFDVYSNKSKSKATKDIDWAKITEAQADNRVCELYGKAGVGEPVARKVVVALKGKLEEKSYEQQAHSFKFALQLERPSEASVMEHEKQILLAKDQAASHRTLRVLLAESHLINRYVYELVFFHRGHVTVKIDNGNDALKELKAGEFDFAVLDQQMPGLAAHELAQQWREHEQATNAKKILPILIVTSDAKENTIRECQRYADLVEVKPVSPYTLVNEVENFIDKPNHTFEAIEEPTTEVQQSTAVHEEKSAQQSATPSQEQINIIQKSTPREQEAITSSQNLSAEKTDVKQNNNNGKLNTITESSLSLDDLLDLPTLNALCSGEGEAKIDERLSKFYSLFETEMLNLETALYTGDSRAYKLVSDRLKGDTQRVGAKALQDQLAQLLNMDSNFVIGNSQNVIEAITQVYTDTQLAYKRHLQQNR